MPKGQKIVDWTKPENDQKLLLAIVKVSEVSKKYQEIAAAFGDGVPAGCISLRIGKLRSMAKDGGTATKGKQNGKKNGGLTSGLKRVSKGKRGKDLEETDTEDIKNEPEYSDGGQAATPPKTPNANADKVISGRVAKRISPRKVSIKNYKKLENPFAEMELANEDGESIFGKPERSEEEDSNPSDEDYGHQNMAVKVEDEV
ncbi:MAG: hypothetical protein HETSPECPRED_006642 [Heterodermia speciosa]|uniref:Uncharacterized protein n=1 Tax=Heterodermia speciosa TaxID=116794 RepID=A0A8H3IGY9_9LECA|nr:MAG: hypothetical protein HETSPECPRED_006642 [Heterodermia speciosa]